MVCDVFCFRFDINLVPIARNMHCIRNSYLPSTTCLSVFWIGWFNIYFTASIMVYQLLFYQPWQLTEIGVILFNFFQVWIELWNNTSIMIFTWYFSYVSSFYHCSSTFRKVLKLLHHTPVYIFSTTAPEILFLLSKIYLFQHESIYDQTWRIDILQCKF